MCFLDGLLETVGGEAVIGVSGVGEPARTAWGGVGEPARTAWGVLLGSNGGREPLRLSLGVSAPCTGVTTGGGEVQRTGVTAPLQPLVGVRATSAPMPRSWDGAEPPHPPPCAGERIAGGSGGGVWADVPCHGEAPCGWGKETDVPARGPGCKDRDEAP